MKVAIIGAGYVGLVTGVCLAAKGHCVIGVDRQAEVIEQLNRGRPHIHEPGLEELLGEGLRSGRWRATTDLDAALGESEIVIIAVGTPVENGLIDLSAVLEVSRGIGAYLRAHERYLAVVVKSTVPPGTTDSIVRSKIARAAGRESFGLGMNPEFLRESEAIGFFMEPDRLVLGYEDERTLRALEELYAPWKVEKLRVNTRTAELIKYASNALLALQISAVNELANLAAALGGIDVMDVIRGLHLDQRWNPIVNGERLSPGILTYLAPGCGFGGSCFPKDLLALRSLGQEKGLPMRVVDAVIKANEAQPGEVVRILEDAVPCLAGQTIAVLGLAFKPGTDDVRESASLKIVRALLEKGAKVIAHDPLARDNFKKALGPTAGAIAFRDSWHDAVAAAEIVIVATAWPEYGSLSQMELAGKFVFDARRMFRPADFAGGAYLAIGRGTYGNE